MFDELSADIVLEIITYLPLNTIASLTLVSRRLHSLINNNENSIYHGAAFYHGYIPSCTTSLDKAHSMYSRRSMGPGPISNWKDFCAPTSPVSTISDRKSASVTKARNANTSTRAGPAKFHLRLHPIIVQVKTSATSGSTRRLAIFSPPQLREVCASPIWPLAKIYGRSQW